MEKERERECFPSWSKWLGLGLGQAKVKRLDLSHRSMGPRTWARLHYLPTHVTEMLTQKWNSQD